MAEGLKESIATYTKGNGGRSKASKASQSQLNSLGVDYGGRFNYGKMYTFQYYTQSVPQKVQVPTSKY